MSEKTIWLKLTQKDGGYSVEMRHEENGTPAKFFTKHRGFTTFMKNLLTLNFAFEAPVEEREEVIIETALGQDA